MFLDDIGLAGKKQNLDPMWKVLNKEVDFGEPTSFLDHVYLGCTQRQCEISKDIVDNYRTMFESRISADGTEKLPYSENFRISSWSYDTRSWPPSSPKVVAASHQSGRSARRAGLEKARLVNLAHLARHTLFSLRST